MVERKLKNFDLGQICDSGQCFRMRRQSEDTFQILASDREIKVTRRADRWLFHCEEKEFAQFWEQYFDLKEDYERYREQINPRDRYLRNAAEFGIGIRILRQDLWEMIVSFLISQKNNFVRIGRGIENLCESYGEIKIGGGGGVYYAFPRPEVLAGLQEDALKGCNLGYRSKYVVRSAQSVVSGEIDLNQVRSMPYSKARTELQKLYGVGEKVADCICLFALHQLEAFTIDTHIHQVLERHYRRGFPNRRYWKCRGVMQQYIFYYELEGTKESGRTP